MSNHIPLICFLNLRPFNCFITIRVVKILFQI